MYAVVFGVKRSLVVNRSVLWNRKKFLPQTRESCLTFFGQQLEAVFAFSFAENSRVIYLRNLITQEI